MKQEKVVEYYAGKMADAYRIQTMLREIRKGVPVVFDSDTYLRHPNDLWRCEIRPLACIITDFNSCSFRAEMIASDGFYRSKSKDGRDCPLCAVRFDNIKKWRYLKSEDLPLLISCENKFPLLEILMKEGINAWENPKNRYKPPEKKD